MPLADVLATLGAAITQDGDPSAVRALILNTPGLTDAEREDLLKIPHARLRPYQSDFYLFETDMIQWGFEHTWNCLRRMDFGCRQGEFARPSHREFVVNFKNKYPSRTHSVREMGRHFLAFLRDDQPVLTRQYPWLAELAEMELREIEVLYAMDNPQGDPLLGDALDRFFDQSVDEAFAAQVVRAECVGATCFTHDMPGIKAACHRAGSGEDDLDFTQPPFMPLPEPQFLVIAREPEQLTPVWYRADARAAALLNDIPEDSAVPVGTLAMRYCDEMEKLPGAPSEDALLGAFLQMLSSWFQRRHILLSH